MNKDIEEMKRRYFAWHYENQEAVPADIADWWTNELTTLTDKVREENDLWWKRRIETHLRAEYEANTGIVGTGRIVCERLFEKLLRRKFKPNTTKYD